MGLGRKTGDLGDSQLLATSGNVEFVLMGLLQSTEYSRLALNNVEHLSMNSLVVLFFPFCLIFK